jgi:hypothetical protein
MVGPAGSTSEGAFSRTNSDVEDEDCPSLDELGEVLPEDWASTVAGVRPVKRQKTAADRTAKDGNALNVMKNPV